MQAKELIRLSKFLSLVLRHRPQLIGITLDEQGWTDVPTLLQKANAAGTPLDMETLRFVVENNNKKRFVLDETKARIRAAQGHSVEVALGYSTQEPPEILYHGTAERFLKSILELGLQKRQRHHVHLSHDVETARSVGSRHGRPVILEVRAGAMQNAGFQFFISENGVWLTDEVPAEYLWVLSFPDAEDALNKPPA